jgi:sialate O-acetylesterase
MNSNYCKVFACASLLLTLSALPQANADVTLPKVIGSHMVLQRDRPLPIWGWADPGEEVTVKLDDASVNATADAEGNWQVTLPAVKADGKAHRMTIGGKNKIELDDILIGEVWIGSGQSNMEFHLGNTMKAKDAVAAANYPQIRLLHVKKVKADKAAKDVVIEGDKPGAKPDSAWKHCTPKTAPNFAAVLYFFGQRLHKELDVPVGLIDSSWGGSPIEQWIVKGEIGGMYNGMIAPVKPFAIRGVIWYQGEANVGIGMKYADKMKALIGGWRQVWGYDFPFYYVEIAPYAKYGTRGLPPLWEAQAASLKIPGTGMVVTTDLVDNIKDIHPKNKFDVGNRLALWALAKNYGKDVVYSGPLYKSMKVDGNKARLSFAHAGGLKSRDEKPLSEFEIAGADGKFVPAEAAVDGDTVVVQAEGVSEPAQVRFGWREVANPNLVNKEGLPASPFQTKDWQGGTGE